MTAVRSRCCRSSPGSGISVAAGVVFRSDFGHARGQRAVAARPRRTATSSKRDSTDAAAKAVTAAGGQVVSRLGVIDAVEAKLTDAQHARVLAAAGVKQITPNSPVTTQAAASVRDNFETGSFANNDGTHRWYGDWVEQNDDNNPARRQGHHRLERSRRQSPHPRRATAPSIAAPRRRRTRPRVTLKFKYSRAGLEAGEYVSVQASGNGGTTWTEVGRISGAGQRHRLHQPELQHHRPTAAAIPRSVSSAR